MAAVRDAIAQLQNEVATTRDQLTRMAGAHDALQANYTALQTSHEALRQASQAAWTAKDAEIAATEQKLKQLLFTQKFDLLDMKTLQPEVFKGRQSDTFKPWARKVKAFCNAKKAGFRKALEWAELQQTEILDPSAMGWEQATVADEKLHDFLL